MNKKLVSKEELLNFVKNYPKKLVKDVWGVSDPPLITYNDFSLGKWPDSIVASTFAYDDNPNGYFYADPSEREYFIYTDQE